MSEGGHEPPSGYASPACLLHELDGSAAPLDRAQILRWRKAERQRLIAARVALPSRTVRALSERIVRHLKTAIGDLSSVTVSTYAPIRNEPGLTSLVRDLVAQGGRHALPVVIERGHPMVFRVWSPGDPLERGIWNIPQPPANAEAVLPDVVIAPIVGYDAECYRLGYGGGYFDRTLASLPRRPRVIGIGYAQSAIPTIYPLAHDIPMSEIVTEEAVIQRSGKS
ncbi:MAG: 5-formyltetrahydrofolate cyclo-ligase [Steroidobacteraceae bacterium]